MARPKKPTEKGFLLLDKKKKTYTEIPDRKTLVDRVTEILNGGTGPSQFAIVPNQTLAFDIEFKISLHEDETKKEKRGRKPKKARKPRKPRKAAEARRGRKPKAKAVVEPAEPAIEAEEAPAKKPRKKRGAKRAAKQAPSAVEGKPAEENK